MKCIYGNNTELSDILREHQICRYYENENKKGKIYTAAATNLFICCCTVEEGPLDRLLLWEEAINSKVYKYVMKAYIKAWRTFRFDQRLTYSATVSFWGVCLRVILGGGVYDSRTKMYVSIVKRK